MPLPGTEEHTTFSYICVWTSSVLVIPENPETIWRPVRGSKDKQSSLTVESYSLHEGAHFYQVMKTCKKLPKFGSFSWSSLRDVCFSLVFFRNLLRKAPTQPHPLLSCACSYRSFSSDIYTFSVEKKCKTFYYHLTDIVRSVLVLLISSRVTIFYFLKEICTQKFSLKFPCSYFSLLFVRLPLVAEVRVSSVNSYLLQTQ